MVDTVYTRRLLLKRHSRSSHLESGRTDRDHQAIADHEQTNEGWNGRSQSGCVRGSEMCLLASIGALIGSGLIHWCWGFVCCYSANWSGRILMILLGVRLQLLGALLGV